MPDYTLTLLIDNAVMRHQPSDTLCVAKKVNGKFTTVFAAASIQPKASNELPLLSSNDFRWVDRYRISASNGYHPGMLVSAVTRDVDINFGNSTTWDRHSLGSATSAPASDFMNATGTGSSQDSFLVKNVPGNVHPVVQMQVRGEWVPIYVDSDNYGGATDKQLTPLNEYAVFWNNRALAGIMVDSSWFRNEHTFSFDSGANTKTIRFGYANRDQPSGPNEEPRFYNA